MLVSGALALCAATFLDSGDTAAQTIVLEMRQGAFEDARVRQAVILSADWLRLAEGTGLRPDGILQRDGRRENDVAARRPDPDAARRLLAEAGYPGKPPLQHFLFYEPPLEKMALALADTLRGIGLVSEPQLVTPQTLDKVIAATRYVTGRQTIELPYLLLTQEKRAAAPPQQLADLAVIGRPAADFEADSRILTISASIANLGSAPAGPHLLWFADRSGALEIPPVRVEGLGPRESRSFKTGLQVPASLLGREVVLLAIVDSEREVPESDEGNNRSEPLTFALPRPAQLPDLVVSGRPEAAFDPTSRQLVVSVAIANIGVAPAGPHLLALIDRSGTIEFPPFEIPELAGRESLRFETKIPVPEAVLGRELVLLAQADPQDSVRERDEKNNFSEALAFLLPFPQRHVDLVVAGAPVVSYDAESRSLTLGLTVANLGNAEAGPSHVAVIDRSDTLAFPPLALGPLAPGEKRSLRTSRRVPEEALGRTLLLFAEIDPEAEIRESDEANNRGEEGKFALPLPPPLPEFRPQRKPERLPDLSISRRPDIAFDPESRQVTVVVTVENRGRVTASPSRLVIGEAGGNLAFPALATPTLAPGASARLEARAEAPARILGGELRLSGEVDPDNRLQEADETNNRSEVATYPLPAPRQERSDRADLTIAALNIRHQPEGSLARVKLTVANRGSAPSPATVVELRAEAEGAMERITIPELAAGALWQADWSVPLGDGVFGRDLSVAAFVDPDDVIPETLETNNRSQQVLAVATPPRTWAVGAALAVVVLLLAVLLLRARLGSGKAKPPAVRLSFKARPDPGAQEVVRRGEAPAVLFELALRPRSDPGSQSVTLASG